MHEQITFGHWLRLKRKAHDLTREGLANRVGCSAETIRKLETEERRPSAQIADLLANEFHVPAEERGAFLRFARGNPQFQPGEAPEEVPWQAGEKPARSNLPAPATGLIGREKELTDLRAYLQDANIRLITLIGPPGIGKTRLAMELARGAVADFPDGVFFAALAPIDDPLLVAPILLQALGWVESKDLPARQQLVAGIGEKRLLLVLDNCEHLIDAVASICADLVSGCSQVKILATSREALRIPGEWLYPVPPLALPREDATAEGLISAQYSALTLFTERARAVRPDFRLETGNAQAVASICRQLDGLPLAIELIAARMRLMSPQALLERLNDSFILFSDGMRGIPARQKTLNNAIGWSYHALPLEEQEIFAGLAVFSGGFSLDTAEAVFSQSFAGKTVIDLVTSLVDKSLVKRVVSSEGEVRFAMLVTIQKFALARLRHADREAEARDAHLAYFLDLAERADKAMRGPDQAKWGRRLESERDNLRAALEWAVSSRQTEAALRLLRALGWPWEVSGHYQEARGWLEKIRALPDAARYPALLAGALNHIGRHSWTQNRFAEARAFLEESRGLAVALGDAGEPVLAETLIWLGLVVHYIDHDMDEARAMFERSLELYRKWGDEHGAALSTFHLGIVEGDAENAGRALALLEESLGLFRQTGDLFFIARVSIYLGHVYHDLGEDTKARRFYEEHLEIDRQIQFWDGMADGWRNVGFLHLSHEEYDQAGRCFDESAALCLAHGLDKPEAIYHSGLLALRRREYSLAQQRYEYLLERARRASDEGGWAGVCQWGLGCAAAGLGQAGRAAKLIAEGRRRVEASGWKLSPLEREVLEC